MEAGLGWESSGMGGGDQSSEWREVIENFRQLTRGPRLVIADVMVEESFKFMSINDRTHPLIWSFLKMYYKKQHE